MSTKIWTTGPCPVATGTGAEGAMEFLGFSKDGFEVRETLFTRAIHDDARGEEMPADQMTLGKAIVISGQVITFDAAVLGRVKNRYLSTGGVGAMAANELGSLLFTEQLTITVMLKYPYQSKSQYTGLDPGLRIPCAFVMGDSGYRVGTRELVVSLVFASIVNFNTSTNSGTIWDSNVSGFPSYT